jgi:uncharacterized delta-60 repeat protein
MVSISPVFAGLPAVPLIDTAFTCGIPSQCGTAGGLSVFAVDRGGNNDDRLHAVFSLPDGRTLLVGRSSSNTVPNALVLAQLNASGGRDNSFGTNGEIETTLQTSTVYQVERDAAGRLWVLYEAPSATNVSLARLLPTGVLDSTFSGDGVLGIDIDATAPEEFGRFALMADGKALVSLAIQSAPQAWEAGFARITTDGNLDSSFRNNGTHRLTPFVGTSRWQPAVVLAQPGLGSYATVILETNAIEQKPSYVVTFSPNGGNVSVGESDFSAVNACAQGAGSTKLRSAVMLTNRDVLAVGSFYPVVNPLVNAQTLYVRIPYSGASGSEVVRCVAQGSTFPQPLGINAVNPRAFVIASYVSDTRTRLDWLTLNASTGAVEFYSGFAMQADRSWPNAAGGEATLSRFGQLSVGSGKIVLGASRLWNTSLDYDFAVARYSTEVLFFDSF